MESADAVGVQDIEEYAHVFEARVHALPVEGHHGVRRIAEDNDTGTVVVRRALYVYEG